MHPLTVEAAEPSGLDTSGAVRIPRGKSGILAAKAVCWSDLSPFEQGYVEALLESAAHMIRTEGGLYNYDTLPPIRWTVLAPEALERIREDCGKLLDLCKAEILFLADRNPRQLGGFCWRGRRAGGFGDLQLFPVTVSLNDAGKVVFQ